VSKVADSKKVSECVLVIVPLREIFLEPHVEDDEEVAAAHLFNFELGYSVASVAPSDGDNGEIVAADNGFQWKLDGDVEVGRQDRADAVDDLFAVSFEGVGGVVEAVAEEEAHEGVGQAVHEEFDRRVVDGAASLHEAAAEDAVVAFVEFFPIADDIAAVVGLIGHHNDGGVAGHGVQTTNNRSPKPVGGGILHAVQNLVTSDV